MWFKTQESLTDRQTKAGLKNIIRDGIASQAMGILTGGAFLTGLYSLHRPAMVKEEGDVEEAVVFRELYSEVRSQVRILFSVEGLRQMISLPLEMIRDISDRIASNDKAEEQ